MVQLRSRGNSLRAEVLALGTAGAVEYVLQMALPVVLVRTLDVAEFGRYRLLWLLASTALALAPLYLPHSLVHFLPLHGRKMRDVLVGNVLFFLCIAGAIVGLLASRWNPLLPGQAKSISMYALVVPGFLLLWVVGSLLDVLPIWEGRARWRAAAAIGLAVLRLIAVSAAALLTRNVEVVFLALIATGGAKVAVLLVYIVRFGSGRLSIDGGLLRQQVRYALPFGVGVGLYLLWGQADQWVVASRYPEEVFAVFSIGAIVLPISTLIRQPLNAALLPRFSAAVVAGDRHQARELIAKSNATAALVLLPVLGLLYVAADGIVALLYTTQYSAAATVMRIYLIGMVSHAFALGHVLVALDAGGFAAGASAVCLGLSVLSSMAGAAVFGPPGAALGSLVSTFVATLWTLHIVARRLGRSSTDLLYLGVSGRVVGVTVVSVALVSFLSAHPDIRGLHEPARLLFVSLLYLVTTLAGFAASGLRGPARDLLMGQRAPDRTAHGAAPVGPEGG